MSERNYDKNPMVIEVKMRIFAYGEVDTNKLHESLQEEDKQEVLFMEAIDAISGDVGCGLDEISATVTD